MSETTSHYTHTQADDSVCVECNNSLLEQSQCFIQSNDGRIEYDFLSILSFTLNSTFIVLPSDAFESYTGVNIENKYKFRMHGLENVRTHPCQTSLLKVTPNAG